MMSINSIRNELLRCIDALDDIHSIRDARIVGNKLIKITLQLPNLSGLDSDEKKPYSVKLKSYRKPKTIKILTQGNKQKVLDVLPTEFSVSDFRYMIRKKFLPNYTQNAALKVLKRLVDKKVIQLSSIKDVYINVGY